MQPTMHLVDEYDETLVLFNYYDEKLALFSANKIERESDIDRTFIPGKSWSMTAVRKTLVNWKRAK